MNVKRLCCGQEHDGVVCPDGRVMCCLCFERVSQDQLVVDPDDGKKWDVCIPCRQHELEMIEREQRASIPPAPEA